MRRVVVIDVKPVGDGVNDQLKLLYEANKDEDGWFEYEEQIDKETGEEKILRKSIYFDDVIRSIKKNTVNLQ